MATFFKPFPTITYRFGNETSVAAFRDITIYADTFDQIKNEMTLYEDYHIIDGQRPDQVSQDLYGTTDFYWTFWLVNPKLRECGWPLSTKELDAKAKADFKHDVMITRTVLTDKFKVNQTVTGLSSGATGKIVHRNLDLGQLTLENVSGTFTNGETVSSTNSDGVLETIVLTSIDKEYNTPLYYENASKEVVDIDPAVGPGSSLTAVTRLDDLVRLNDECKLITTIKQERISLIVDSFKRAIQT